jgi:hypothetical protein
LATIRSELAALRKLMEKDSAEGKSIANFDGIENKMEHPQEDAPSCLPPD